MHEHWVFGEPSTPFRSIPNVTTCIPQLTFSFYRHQPIRADFSGGQITSDAGLLPLRAFDQRHHLTRDWAALLTDPRVEDRVAGGYARDTRIVKEAGRNDISN